MALSKEEKDALNDHFKGKDIYDPSKEHGQEPPTFSQGGMCEEGYADGGEVPEIDLGNPLPFETTDYAGPQVSAGSDTFKMEGVTPPPPIMAPRVPSLTVKGPLISPEKVPAAVSASQSAPVVPPVVPVASSAAPHGTGGLSSAEFDQLIQGLKPSRGQRLGQGAMSALAGLADAIETGVARTNGSNFQKNIAEDRQKQKENLLNALKAKYETGYKGKQELAGQAESRSMQAARDQTAAQNTQADNVARDAAAVEAARHNRVIEGQGAQRVAQAGQREGRLAQGAEPSKPIDPGTPDYKVAQDLALGRMTPSFFRTLQAYNRDAGKKAALYAKAAEINPNFNEADFERGFKFISNPQTGRQLAALDNAISGIPSLVEASNAAKRSGVTAWNKYANPVKVAMGSQTFSNLNAAHLAWADEVSGALGFGSATDMKLKLGLDLTPTALGPQNFESVVNETVLPFLQRKKGTILNQGSVYGTSQNNSSLTPDSGAGSKMLRFGNNAPFQVTKQPDGTWKSDSGAIYDDSGKRIK